MKAIGNFVGALILIIVLSPSRSIAQTNTNFLGLGWGIGLALTVDSGRTKYRVESASVVNGIVRVEEERNAQTRVLLESHYFFEPGKSSVLGEKWGHGPFLAIQPGDNEIVNAIGFGWMLGLRRGEATSKESWNIGIGIIVDPNAKTLGDGLSKNAPLPPGETEVRYKTEAETSFMIAFSFSF